MYALISPAKKLNNSPKNCGSATIPSLQTNTNELATILKTKTALEIADLMGLSEKLANLNFERYQQFGTQTNQAIFTFQGDVYQELDASTLPNSTWGYAHEHLGILSGLYGLLRPLDAMNAYRLEMSTKLATKAGKNLYDYWNDSISITINNYAQKSNFIINLASQEYFKAIQIKHLEKPVIDVQFKEYKNEKYKTIGIFAKKARGLMARHILETRPKQPKELLSFSAAGYQHNPNLSDDKKLVFTR